jgi:DNA primase
MIIDPQILESNKLAKEIYHKQLRCNPKATKYCLDRGLTKSTLSKYQIGYANNYNILVQVLRSKGLPYSHLTSYDGSCDLLKNRIIIPCSVMGNVVLFTGRSFPTHDPKYLYSRGPISFLFNQDLVNKSDRIIVVESPICAMTLTQLGLPAVAKFGTGKEILSNIPKSSHIYFMPDIEKSKIGVIDSVQCSAWMYSEGYKHIKICLLSGYEDKIDPNSYMLTHEKSDLLRHLKQSLTPEDVDQKIFNSAYEKYTKVDLTPTLRVGNDIDKVKSQVKLSNIINQYTSIDKETGTMLTCACPFHNESKPSFFVYKKTETFFCFGCRTGGDVIAFVQKIEGISFMEAINKLKALR